MHHTSKFQITIFTLLINVSLFGQNNWTQCYGFRHLQSVYHGDTVDILVKSKSGDENKRKPLLLFCQGSLPIPLIIKYDDNGKQGIYNVFVFNPDSLSNDYHLAIIGKPYIPLIADQKKLGTDLTFSDANGKYPAEFIARNLLDYYVERDIASIKLLQTQPWVSTDALVVAGHSEGSAIAAKIAWVFPRVTKLIYSGGSPLGRVMTIIERSRAEQIDSSSSVENEFDFWQKTIAEPDDVKSSGDTKKGYFQFSVPPPIDYLVKLKIPVLVTYGTKDYGAVAANDYLRITMVRLKKENFTFKDYIGLDHNFFPLLPNGKANYETFNWDKVAECWRHWLMLK